MTSTTFISGNRVEEVKPADAAGLLASGRDRRDRQRRRVARDQAIVADDRLQLREQGLLGGEILDDRLDHDVAAGKAVFRRR